MASIDRQLSVGWWDGSTCFIMDFIVGAHCAVLQHMQETTFSAFSETVPALRFLLIALGAIIH